MLQCSETKLLIILGTWISPARACLGFVLSATCSVTSCHTSFLNLNYSHSLSPPYLIGGKIQTLVKRNSLAFLYLTSNWISLQVNVQTWSDFTLTSSRKFQTDVDYYPWSYTYSVGILAFLSSIISTSHLLLSSQPFYAPWPAVTSKHRHTDTHTHPHTRQSSFVIFGLCWEIRSRQNRDSHLPTTVTINSYVSVSFSLLLLLFLKFFLSF